MTPGRASIKKQILLATISIIEKEGINSVTTRKVAKEADVNIAAINYYFGSKEELLREIVTQTIHHFFSDMEIILAKKNLNRYLVLKILLAYILRGTLQYPNIIKALFMKTSYISQDSRILLKQLNTVIKQAMLPLLNSTDNSSQKKEAVALMQMTNTVIASGITSSMHQEWSGIDLNKKENLLYYIEELIHRYIPRPKEKHTEKEDRIVDTILDQVFHSPDSMWGL